MRQVEGNKFEMETDFKRSFQVAVQSPTNLYGRAYPGNTACR